MIKRFTVYRPNVPDATHNSFQKNANDEPQFEGVIFSDGTCALRWLTAAKSTSIWNSFNDAMLVHEHPEYGTKIVWADDTPIAEPNVQEAIDVGIRHGGHDEAHHKAWVIDQMLRALLGPKYEQTIRESCDGPDGPNSWIHDEGIAP